MRPVKYYPIDGNEYWATFSPGERVRVTFSRERAFVGLGNGGGPHMREYHHAADVLGLHGDATPHLLDVGCGSGYGTAYLKGLGCHAIGIDVEEACVQFANWAYADKCYLYQTMSATDMSEFHDGRFDRLTSIDSIEHVADGDKALSEIARVLRPGGKAYFATPAGNLGQRSSNPFHPREYSQAQLIERLEAVGFEVEILKGPRVQLLAVKH
jgi:2-polyprenyl-3-methyl-5-hydroxy-6-metoxy-1,4-benzoquinol methylase